MISTVASSGFTTHFITTSAVMILTTEPSGRRSSGFLLYSGMPLVASITYAAWAVLSGGQIGLSSVSATCACDGCTSTDVINRQATTAESRRGFARCIIIGIATHLVGGIG